MSATVKAARGRLVRYAGMRVVTFETPACRWLDAEQAVRLGLADQAGWYAARTVVRAGVFSRR